MRKKLDMPPVGHVVSLVLEELSRAGEEKSLEQLLKKWNFLIKEASWFLVPSDDEEFVVSQKKMAKPVCRLQLQTLRILLGVWGQPQIYQKILEECKSKAKH